MGGKLEETERSSSKYFVRGSSSQSLSQFIFLPLEVTKLGDHNSFAPFRDHTILSIIPRDLFTIAQPSKGEVPKTSVVNSRRRCAGRKLILGCCFRLFLGRDGNRFFIYSTWKVSCAQSLFVDGRKCWMKSRSSNQGIMAHTWC